MSIIYILKGRLVDQLSRDLLSTGTACTRPLGQHFHEAGPRLEADAVMLSIIRLKTENVWVSKAMEGKFMALNLKKKFIFYSRNNLHLFAKSNNLEKKRKKVKLCQKQYRTKTL